MPTYVWWLLVAVFLGASACSGGAADNGAETAPRGSAAPSRSPVPSTTVPSVPVPSVAGLRVEVPSHCGVLGVRVADRLWLADPALGDHNPPTGWNENRTPGSFVQTGETTAEFHGDDGQHATFRLAPVGSEDPNAGCE